MRPGDLIFYTNSKGTVNHVAMYIGNGQIVHAASRRSGIKISTWNYRTPKDHPVLPGLMIRFLMQRSEHMKT